MRSNYEWTPTVGLGPIKFGAPIQQYVDAGLLVYQPFLEEFGGDANYVNKEEDISVSPDEDLVVPREQQVVDTILCDRSLLYQGTDLFGLGLNDVIKTLGREPDQSGETVEIDEELQISAEFDELGLVLWFFEGVCVSAAIDDADYTDDDETLQD